MWKKSRKWSCQRLNLPNSLINQKLCRLGSDREEGNFKIIQMGSRQPNTLQKTTKSESKNTKRHIL